MRFIASVVVLALAGCATYGERMAQEPWHVVDSTKSPEDFSGCLVPLMREMPANFATGPDGDATVHTASIQHGPVLAAVRVLPTRHGVRAELRSATQTGWYRRVAERMSECR